MQKRQKTRSKQAPCVKYYRGLGLVEPCPWSVAEQTVPNKDSYVWWKWAQGDCNKYMDHFKRKKERK